MSERLGAEVHRLPFAVQAVKRFVLMIFGGLTLMVTIWTTTMLHSTVFTFEGESRGLFRAILVETLGTFLLVLTIMAMAVDKRAPAGWAGLMIGLSVTCAVVVLGPLTGAAINPAP